MATKYPDLFEALARPFDDGEVKTRTQAGRTFSYITARVAMNRLDEVVGPEGWWDEYVPGENSVLCKLSLCLPDGHVLTKCDAGGYAGMADQGDDDKSGYSDAFKRACAKFGVARYLYRDGIPNFHPGEPQQSQRRPMSPTDPPRPQRQQQSNGQQRQHDGPPRSGKALFAWTKEKEQTLDVGLLKYLNSWAKLHDFPGRMVDWDAEQVSLAHAEAVRKLESLRSRDEIDAARTDGEVYDDEPDAGSRG